MQALRQSDTKKVEVSEQTVQYWLELLNDQPPIHVLHRSNEPAKYVYRCTWTNLPIENAFVIPGWCLTGNKNSTPTLYGRFRDLACLYSWVLANSKGLGKNIRNRVVEYLFNETAGADDVYTETPNPNLLRVNGGHLTSQDWAAMYMDGNRTLQARINRPHIFAEAEHKLRETNKAFNKKPAKPPMDKVDILQFDQTLTHTLNEIAGNQSQLHALGQTDDRPTSQIEVKSSATSTDKKRTSEKMNVDPKKPAAKKPKSTAAAPAVPDFLQFINAESSAVGNGVASAVASAPKKKRRSPVAGLAKPASAGAVAANPNEAIIKAMYEQLMAGKKVQAAVSSSSSAPAAAAAAPTQKRNITLRKGSKKTETESKDFYHDLCKLALSDESFNTTGIVKAALLLVDNKGVLHLVPLLGSQEATVTLV